MRVFVTGASGFVGSAVVQELLAAGHQVLGLVRSDAGVAAVAAIGADVHRGDVTDLDSLRRGAEGCDGVVHTAFNHDFSRFAENCANDARAIEALGAVLRGSDRPLIITSGIGVLPASNRLATEDDRPTSSHNPRIASETAADVVAAGGVRVSSMRLPPSVHGPGDGHGFVPALVALARKTGVAAYPNEGTNRWPAVHRLDAARLYRLVLEAAPAAGTRIHAVAEEGIPVRDIAAAIGARLGLPVESRSGDALAEHFGWMAHFAQLNCPASGAHTQSTFGWHPTQPGLLDDLRGTVYIPD